MSPPESPDWELLPHRAAEFFGLDEEFDLLSLKRAYNRLLRQFKPERCPNEFQKIRAAYESLQMDLRYGSTKQPESEPEFDWQSIIEQDIRTLYWEPPVSTQDDSGDTSDGYPSTEFSGTAKADQDSTEAPPAGTRPVPIHERLLSESPETLYSELDARQFRTPYDYYALALLSDAVPGDWGEEGQFARHLLEGLQAHPDDPALFQLLQDYLSEDVELSAAPALLIELSAILTRGGFFRMTERLWDRLINDDFEVFRSALRDCEKNLFGRDNLEYVTFLLHILKRAIWLADEEWVASAFEEVQSHAQQLPYWADQELDFLDMLKDYHDGRRDFIARGICSTWIDQAIADYCLLDEQEADRRILDCQQQLLMNGDQLLSEFPRSASDTSELWTTRVIWSRITRDVAERSLDELPPDSPPKTDQTYQLIRDVYRSLDRSGFHVVNAVLVLLFTVPILLGGGCLLVYKLYQCGRSLWNLELWSAFLSFLAAVGILIGIFAGAVIVDLLKTRFVRRKYWEKVRFILPDFFSSENVSLDGTVAAVEEIKEEEVDERSVDDLMPAVETMREDDGLFFYTEASRIFF